MITHSVACLIGKKFSQGKQQTADGLQRTLPITENTLRTAVVWGEQPCSCQRSEVKLVGEHRKATGTPVTTGYSQDMQNGLSEHTGYFIITARCLIKWPPLSASPPFTFHQKLKIKQTHKLQSATSYSASALEDIRKGN